MKTEREQIEELKSDMILNAAPRPFTPEDQKKIQELMQLAITTPREIADVFVQFHAHINGISVQIHSDGWRGIKDQPSRFNLFSGPDFQDAINTVISVITDLNKKALAR